MYLLDLSVIAHLKDFAGIQPLLSAPFLLTRSSSPELYRDIFDLLMQMQIEYFRKNLYSEITVYALMMTMFVKLGTDYSNRLATADTQNTSSSSTICWHTSTNITWTRSHSRTRHR